MGADETKAHQEAVGHPVVLGKLEPKEDERNLMFASYAAMKRLLPKAPTAQRWSTAVIKNGGAVPLYRNDSLPDCTCAAVGHGAITQQANAGNFERPSEKDVLEMFDATGPRNQGRYMLDILNRWRSVGFGDTEREKVFAFVQVDPKDRGEVETALWLFGGLYVGLALPLSAQTQLKWSVVPGPSGAAGSWGGHAVWIPDFTKQRGIDCWTWGSKMNMTWGFFRKYADEAYAVLSPDWASGARKAPSGFNLKQLTEDLGQL